MARINTIKEYDVANGPGVRASVWFQGCPHHCKGCFNEETWNPNGAGREYGLDDLNKIISILENSPTHKDLSILGGEPLTGYNIDATIEICKTVKAARPDINIWIWTGWTFEFLKCSVKFNKLLQYFDVLVDGKFELENKDLKLMYRGSSNQRVIDIKKTKENNNVVVFLDI